MRLRSKFLIIASMMAFLGAAPSAEALVKKPASRGTTSKHVKSKGKKQISKKNRHKKVPYILAPKTAAIIAPDESHQHHFSPEFDDALARGDLTQAYRDLQLEEASDKVGYMINQVLMAQGKSMGHAKTLTPFDRGTAYHNLYLFLARQGRPAPKFVKEAAKYYEKSARKPGYADKANVLLAALYATAGDTAKSDKYFGKVDVNALTHGGDDYNGLEYLATYYAATKNTQRALTYLDQAYKLNPGPLLLWLHVGDDFWAVESDEAFQDQVGAWRTRHAEMLAQLQRDKSTHDSRKKSALTAKHKKKKKKR